jgi:glycosyltransferase involved in cell wall biosynthesis
MSVITATYNAAKTLQACIDSVAAEGLAELEHIVIDGGSRDGTVDVIRANEQRIGKWVSEPDRGVYDAWNKGLALARGEWIAFLGADDTYVPGALAAYRQLATDHPEAELLSSQVVYVSDGGTTRVIGGPWSWPRFQKLMTIAHPGSFHRRALFERLGSFDVNYRIVGDYELLLRARGSLRAVFMPQVTVRMSAGGLSDSTRALGEAARAKRQSGGRPLLLNVMDEGIARAKFAVARRVSH